MIIELFSLCVTLTAEALQEKIDWKLAFSKNFRYKGSSPTSHFSCHKTRWMGPLYSTRISPEFSFFLPQFTCL